MPDPLFLRRHLFLSGSSPSATGGPRLLASLLQKLSSYYEEQTRSYNTSSSNRITGSWLTLPPFDGTADGAALGREASHGGSAELPTAAATSALKWVSRCCPELSRSLVQKLFRLRQVFANPSSISLVSVFVVAWISELGCCFIFQYHNMSKV